MELQYRQQSQDHKGLGGNNNSNPSLINHSLAFASVINLRLECTITVQTTGEWPIHTSAVSHLLFPSIPIRSCLPLAPLCASLCFLIPFPALSSCPPHIKTVSEVNRGPTGTQQICTNTHSRLGGLEKHHSKTKRKEKQVASLHRDTHSYMLTTISLLSWKEKKNFLVFCLFFPVIWPVSLSRVGKELLWFFWTIKNNKNNTEHQSYYLCFAWHCTVVVSDRLWI